MPESDFTLSNLISPISTEDFFKQYWEKQPLYVSHDDSSFDGTLLDLQQLDALISGGHDEGLSLSVANRQDNGKVDVREFGGKRGVGHDFVYSAFAEGATVRTRGMERLLPSGQQLTADLEKQLSAPVHMNMYLTPSNSQGFNTHQDGHDVFILQASGRKRWRVYNKPLELTSDRVVRGRSTLFGDEPKNRTTPFEKTPEDLEVLLDVTLEPGDFLYIPRGFYHDARTTDELSMHITVGVYVLTWHDVLIHALATLFEESPVLRRALPPGFASDNAHTNGLQSQATAVLDEIHKHLTPEKLEATVEYIGKRFVESRHSPFQGYLQDVDQLQKGINDDDRFAVRGEVLHRMRENNGKLHLTYNGRNLALPAEAKPTLNYMAEHNNFSINDLPSDLSTEHNTKIVEHLVVHGFLTYA